MMAAVPSTCVGTTVPTETTPLGTKYANKNNELRSFVPLSHPLGPGTWDTWTDFVRRREHVPSVVRSLG